MSVLKNLVKSPLLPRGIKTYLKDFALGPDYDLSVAWVSTRVIHKINLTYRNKDKPTNILSFPLGPNEGEILLCRVMMEDQEAIPLFIHGLVHLKGYDHGSRMKREEKKVITFFNSHATNHCRRP